MVKKIALLIICTLIVSSAHAISFPGHSKQKAQPTPETPTRASATTKGAQSKEASIKPALSAQIPIEPQLSNTIPLNLLELQFDQCVEGNAALGSRLVGSYCQCIATEYYQNLPHLGYLRFLDGLAAKEKDALKYEKQTSEFCFAAIAKMVGP
ncbi:MAG: hypothetical protein U1E78_07145 [Gammaproteobacteria bacterium]